MNARQIVTNLRDGATVVMVKPRVPEVLPILEAYYATHGAGGSVHIITDDGNLGASFAQSCLRMALDPSFPYNSEDDDVFMAWLLTQCSATQQGKLSRLCRAREPAKGAEDRFWERADALIAHYNALVGVG